METKVLVIDENLELLDVIKFLLKEEGFDVAVSMNSVILDKLECIKPNLILVDEAICNGTIINICRNIKSNILTANTSIIISSNSVNIAETTKEAKADGYIKKPFEILELVGIIKNTMQINNNFDK